MLFQVKKYSQKNPRIQPNLTGTLFYWVSDFTLERGGSSSYRRLQRIEEGQHGFLDDGERRRHFSTSMVQNTCLILFLLAAVNEEILLPLGISIVPTMK